MDAIAKTAYYCCGVRAADAASPRPICGDTLAQRFMTAEARAVFRGFADLTMPNRSNATRARIIDDWLRRLLAADAAQLVILLGAGFDTRAFRLAGGRWVELDQPAVIAAKQAALPPAEAANPLTRVAIDFATEQLADRLAPWAGSAITVVVMEGVSMYLGEAELRATLATLRRVLPRHRLICDLMTAAFARRYGGEVRQRIAALGGSFATLLDDPEAAVVGAGYRPLERMSMVARARELGAIPIPKLALATVLRGLRDGYCAYMFAAED